MGDSQQANKMKCFLSVISQMEDPFILIAFLIIIYFQLSTTLEAVNDEHDQLDFEAEEPDKVE